MSHVSLSKDYYVVINDELEINIRYDFYDDDTLAVADRNFNLIDEDDDGATLSDIEAKFDIDLHDIGMYVAEDIETPQMKAFLVHNIIDSEEL